MTLYDLDSTGIDLAPMVRTIAGETHQDYRHVCELRELYMKLISGKDVNSLLQQFVRREDPELFKQRCRLTQAITPEVAAQLMAPFYKVTRVNNITEVVDFPGTEGYQAKKDRVAHARKEYNGDRSLDDYMDTRFIELSFCDPNSFIVTEFYDGERDANGVLIGPVVPYPHEVSCVDALNFEYRNNRLEWLIKKSGNSYTMYRRMYSVVFTKAPKDLYSGGVIGNYVEVNTANGPIVIYKMDDESIYVVDLYVHKSKEVPAKRVGYKRDLETEGRTFVPPLHDAKASFMKSIKTVSEFDISMALHAHPQKLAQQPKCVGTAAEPCSKGYNPEGKICGVCQGLGVAPISTTGQDAITIPLDPEKPVDLQNLVKYVDMPVALLEFQYKFTRELKDSAREAMYNTDVFARTSVAATATEKKLSMESVYDVLIPFAKQYSAMWKHQMVIIAGYVDAAGIIIEHVFPKDFGFRTRDELIGQISTASESGAPAYVKTALSRELAASLFIDNPGELKRIDIKERFFPFADKTQAEIALIINGNFTSNFNKVLWANFNHIFEQIESEQEEQGVYIYDLAEPKIRELVAQKVNQMIAETASVAPAFSVPDESTGDIFGNEDEPNAA